MAATTTEEICRRAGVTQLTGALDSLSFTGRSIEERVDLFVERAWEMWHRPTFQVFLEILLVARHDSRIGAAVAPYRGGLRQSMDGIWAVLFEDLDISEESIITTEQVVMSTLSGLALIPIFIAEPRSPDNALAVLKDVLVRTRKG